VKRQTKSKATKAKTSKAATSKKTPAKRTQKPQAETKTAPKQKSSAAERYPNLPAVGSVMIRKFKGDEIKVKVLADGYEYEGETYRSLSGLARHITGYMISGPVFFKLVEPKRPQKAEKK
jgi:hypothetical protein